MLLPNTQSFLLTVRIAILTTDNREIERNYFPEAPYFGTAPTGLLAGFAGLTESGDGRSEAGDESAIHNSKSKIQNPAQRAEIHVISCTQRPMCSPEKLADNIWFHSLHVPKIGWLRTGYAGCILAVRKKLREIQPDVVHAQGTERDCAMSAIFAPYPRLLTIHGNLRLIRQVLRPRPWSALALQALVEGFAVPRFDGILCITNYTKHAIEHETPKTWVVPNAVDPAFLEVGEKRDLESGKRKAESEDPRAEIVRESGKTGLNPPIQNSKSKIQNPTILVVANVDARKNQNVFIQALDPLAASTGFEVRFFGRCGDDQYGREFQELVAARPWCKYGGMIGREALRKEFATATLLALPTREDNCPMVVLEAQAAGIPVMASNVGGVPDLVEDEVTGLLTDPLQPETMRTAISRLLSDSDLATRLAKNGRRQALENFHPRVIAEKHLAIYQELAGKLGAGPTAP